MNAKDAVWQLFRAVEKRKLVETAAEFKFYKSHVDYCETIARQNGASEELIELAYQGNGFLLQAKMGGQA